MNIEVNADRVASLHRVLAEPARLGIAQALLREDLSPGDVARLFRMPTNLVAHHIGLLVDTGVARKCRSEGDARRSYVSLRRDDKLVAELVRIGAPASMLPGRIAFVCTRNSARSKIAAALWRRCSSVPVVDAGTSPSDRPHPLAVKACERLGLEIDPQTRHMDDAVSDDDLVVAVCDDVHERLGPQQPHLHWAIPDPANSHRLADFLDAAENLATRISQFTTSQEQP